MKEQEKGDGSDGKESLKTKSDESGEEKNGDDDNQKSAQKKKGKAVAGGASPPGSVCLLLPNPQAGGSILCLPWTLCCRTRSQCRDSCGKRCLQASDVILVGADGARPKKGQGRRLPSHVLPAGTEHPSLWLLSAVVYMWVQSGLSLGRHKGAEEGQVL